MRPCDIREGDVLRVTYRRRADEGERLWRVRSITQMPGGTYVTYEPIRADGSWDHTGGLWGAATIWDRPRPFGVVAWQWVRHQPPRQAAAAGGP